jgi:hypothetical protein
MRLQGVPRHKSQTGSLSGCILSPMNRFGTVREAKEYLIHRIRAQANQDGVALSDVERQMLYFSESGWTLPDMKAVSHRFEQNYDQDEYEQKIGQIVRRICDQPESSREDGWDEAVDRLADEDHYLSVLIGGASRKSGKSIRMSFGVVVRAVLAIAFVAAVFVPVYFFVLSRIRDSGTATLIGEGTLVAAVLLGAFVASRGYR